MGDGQPSDSPSTRPSVDEATERWVSFADLAQRRGISRAAASKLVRRHGWRRQTDNQGRVLILVPEAALDRPSVRPPPSDDDTASVRPSVGGGMARLAAGALAALEDAVAALREQLDAANARAERAEADRAEERQRADDLRDRLNAMQEQLADAHAALQAAAAADTRTEQAERGRERAEVGWDAERARADALRDRLTTMQEQLADAHAALQAAEVATTRAQQAEASRDTERQRADRAEQGREADRARADVLQAKLNDMQVQVTARQEVIDAAEVIRKADDARLARGRWARLRAAWRGR
jgi:DNA repair exonuclease SbcCD ATPase subunit